MNFTIDIESVAYLTDWFMLVVIAQCFSLCSYMYFYGDLVGYDNVAMDDDIFPSSLGIQLCSCTNSAVQRV